MSFPSGEKGIDDWQKKIDEDFNQIYFNLYKEYEKNPDSFRGMEPLLPPPVGMNSSVPQVVITNVKNESKIEKIDHIKRTEQTFDDFPVPEVTGRGTRKKAILVKCTPNNNRIIVHQYFMI